MTGKLPRVMMPEEATRVAPIKIDTHSVEECDIMLMLQLTPKVADAWLDERVLAMHDKSI